jgi:hypothetical protein
MKRRDFIRYSLLGSGSFVLGLGVCRPQPADAFIWGLLFRALLNSAFSSYEMKNEQWYKDRLDVMLAEREFIREEFTQISVAQVDSSPYGVIATSYRQDLLETNVGFAFPRVENGTETIALLGGPAAVGMAHAAEYLRLNRHMSHGQIQDAILPSLTGGTRLSNMEGWSDATSFNAYPNNYSDRGVRIRYDAVEPYSGGFGTIDVTVNANQQIQIPQIRVDFT